MPLVVACAGVVALAGVLWASGALQLRGSGADPTLRVSADGANVGLQQRGANPASALTVKGEEQEPAVRESLVLMPEDVRKWLEHLKRVDKQREAYNTAFVMNLMSKIGSLQPGTYIDEDSAAGDEARRKTSAHGVVGDVDTFFGKLTEDFQSLQPPVECGPIAAQYSSVLLETRGMLGQITTAITNLDTRALESMQGTTFARLDTKADETNGLIVAICTKYHEPNKYDVFVDKGSALGLGSALTGGTSMGMDQKALQKLADELLNEGIGR
ncbi:MAG: hypothetical protein M3R13_04610 [Armatimonadota bacterium]|nr:hypothetical protein [Armatimonadota bacterium]